jgi:hypothetical protein
MVEASPVPRQISRTEYIIPKTDQEAQTSQIVTERSPETAQSVYVTTKQPYEKTPEALGIVTENSSETAQLGGASGKHGYEKAPLNASTTHEKYCLYCALAFTPNPKNPKAKFCSTRHRIAYWRRQRKLYPKQVPQLQTQPLPTAAVDIEELNKSSATDPLEHWRP